MRGVRAGSIQSAVRDAMKGAGGLECASIDLGISVSTLSYGTSVDEARPGGLGVNYLDRLGRMHRAAALPMAQHFSTLAGGFFEPVNLDGLADVEIHDLTAEFSEVLREHAFAHSSASQDPSGYTDAEKRKMIESLTRLSKSTARLRAGLVASLEGRG
ncbi:hypothetical protein Q4560_05035 [Celeribacter halophilus]|uniref:hypothetical protein n=1 Tax=Celeribacter halophilus TaxID=576117 RepID=UPI0026E32A06|nr:hypothetical protein [Celeribacter halophilus]MDO6722621.1 hypothetical protein [Celeribacter halophilus]